MEFLGTTQFSPHYYLFLALGSKSRDESFSHECFQIGVRGIDQLIQDSPERYQHFAGTLLPIVGASTRPSCLRFLARRSSRLPVEIRTLLKLLSELSHFASRLVRP